MIITIFQGGDYKSATPDNGEYLIPLLTDSNDTQYNIALALLVIVALLVPVMLCVKPCCFRGAPVEEDQQ